MPSAKISALPLASALDGTELVPVVQGGVTKVTSSLGLRPVQPRILKKFLDLANVTKTDSTISTVLSIDQNSPFGGPAMKVVATAGSSGYVQFDLTNLNIPGFDGNVASSIWFDEVHRFSSCQLWLAGDTTPTIYTAWQQNLFSGGDVVGGHRTVIGGPIAQAQGATSGGSSTFSNTASISDDIMTVTVAGGTLAAGQGIAGTGIPGGTKIVEQLTGAAGGAGTYSVSIPCNVGSIAVTANTGFVPGVSPLKMVRLRVTVLAGANTTFWIRDVFIPAKQRPVVCFTFDDADISWMTRARGILNAAGVKATFAVYSTGINLGASYITSADVQTLAADGHQITSHNVNDYRLQTLASHSNGEQNGSGSSNDSVGYITEYHTCRQALEALGVPPADFMYHSWVQGGADTQAVELMRGCGVDLARGALFPQPMVYGHQWGNDGMNMRHWTLGNTRSLARNKYAIDQAVRYGGLLVFMGHVLADTSLTSITYAESEFRELVAYAVASGADILTMRQLRDQLRAIGALDRPNTNPSPPVRMIGRLIGANMNSTADQAIALPAGSWVVTQIYAAKGSISMTTAAGGIYTGAGKTGTAAVAAGQAYTALAGAATDVATLTPNATPTVTLAAAGTGLYLSLTTGQGAAATADIFVYGRPA